MKDRPVRHAAEFALFRAAEGVLRALPHPAARRVGAALGSTLHALDGHHRRLVRRNLARAFPDWEPARRAATTRACFRHFGAVFADTVSALRLDAGRFCKLTASAGWEHLRAAEAEGRGVLVMSAHHGHWEMASWAIGAFHGPLQAMGRPADNPHFDRWLTRLRTRFANVALAKRGSVRAILRALDGGARIGFLIDQRVRPRDGILVPFFGHPAWTSPLLARLALRTGAPIVPVFADFAPGGGYRVTFAPPVELPAGEGEEAVAELTRRCLALVEAATREAPERWFWLHDRWKGAPEL